MNDINDNKPFFPPDKTDQVVNKSEVSLFLGFSSLIGSSNSFTFGLFQVYPCLEKSNFENFERPSERSFLEIE